MIDSRLWQLESRGFLHRYYFEAERPILFNGLSGQTHLGNVLCADVLEILEQTPLSSQLIVESLAQRNGFSPNDYDWQVYIENMLTTLDELGILSPSVS